MKKFLLFALFATQIFAFSANKFVNDARSQIGVTISYDPSYERLAYPMGDVDIKKGRLYWRLGKGFAASGYGSAKAHF